MDATCRHRNLINKMYRNWSTRCFNVSSGRPEDLSDNSPPEVMTNRPQSGGCVATTLTLKLKKHVRYFLAIARLFIK